MDVELKNKTNIPSTLAVFDHQVLKFPPCKNVGQKTEKDYSKEIKIFDLLSR